MNASRRRPSSGLAVVKLGGSLARSPRLTDWLDAAAGCPDRLVLVPGGGPFADQVRDLQGHWGFDDRAADAMAILAMEQFGRMLAALRPGLGPADSRAAVTRALRAGEVPVWMPARMTTKRPDEAKSWDVTSDSLAAWLAGALGAAHLILVKSAEAPRGTVTARDLAAAGLVDPAFPGQVAASGARCVVLGPGQSAALRAGIRTVLSTGLPVACC